MGKKKAREVLPVNREAKDTFFKTVYGSRERLKGLAEFLLGVQSDMLEVANVCPVLFGNKENDLSFLCNGVIYCMMEEQSSVCLNMPYRLLEYITAGLRGMIDAEQSLYGSRRIAFPLPKLYSVQVGIVSDLSCDVCYDMRLSESFPASMDQSGERIEPDLEVVVHVFDFRMTLSETLAYIEEAILPERLKEYADNDLLRYALVANSLTYVQRAGRRTGYKASANVAGAAGLFDLLKARGIFVDLFSDQEVCNMTAATFSRDDILRYQGMEEGVQQGLEQGAELATTLAIQNMLELGVPEEKILLKYSREELDRAQEAAAVEV